MVTTLRSGGKLPTLPKGLPALTAKPSTFVIYFAANQSRKVKSVLTGPDEALIVGGVPILDEHLQQPGARWVCPEPRKATAQEVVLVQYLGGKMGLTPKVEGQVGVGHFTRDPTSALSESVPARQS